MKNIILIATAIALFVVGLNAMFIVDEKNQAIVTQFGRPVGEPITSPGLQFKIPFIQKVQFFDRRFLEWDGDANQIPTSDKKFIFVDTFARWEITDALQFFLRLRDERGAQSRLDDILDGETRNAVASNDLLDLVRSTNREPEVTEDFLDDIETLEDISIGRDAIEALVLERANERVLDLGIRILDFRFKRVNYVEDVQQNVFDRMISERNRIADQFRSEGQGEARVILGEMERELARIRSEARREAQQIRGRADAEATRIYAEAFNRNNVSRDLYQFLRTMEAFEKTMDENTTVILSTDSEFYRFLMGGN
ncbi:protease FtsH subunit HflC [Cyclonatronum proteinivorum]|uniref:Protein HflC n=1 Tax=Cyclonatronum proteinivorum TaxID=1457365 RepID=A0A345UP36_9BACT|nr:protease modulator HflC [Cyclonatronum proteinivorum]AXJ02238.1 protease FtsH subunit HflC [Cyclonatronum proteinivorum]